MSKRNAVLAKKAAAKALNPGSEGEERRIRPSTAGVPPPSSGSNSPQGQVPQHAQKKQQNNSGGSGATKQSNKITPSVSGGGGKNKNSEGAVMMKEREIRFKAYIEELNTPAYGEEGFSLWYSANPYRRDIEKAWVEYSLVWIPIVFYLFLSGLVDQENSAAGSQNKKTQSPLVGDSAAAGFGFGDKEYFIMGCLLMMGTYIWPFMRCKYLHFPTLNAMFYGVAVYSLLLHYYISPFWTNVMHMRLGFNSHLVVSESNPYPLWLFLIGIPYQAALTTGSIMVLRRLGHVCNYGPYWKSRDTNEFFRLAALVIRCYFYVIYPFFVAFLEIILTANPYTAKFLCYDSQYWGVLSGTVIIGCGYMIAMPVWLWAVSEDEYRPDFNELMRPKSNMELFLSKESRLFHSVIGNAAAIGILFFVLETYVKPEMKAGGFTKIVNDMIPDLASSGDGCLENPAAFANDWWGMLAALTRGTLVSVPQESVPIGEEM